MIKRITGGAVGLVVILVVIALKFGAGWGIGFLGAKAGAPDVGECVTLSGSSTDAQADKATCGADGVLYKVVSDDGDCDDTEINFTESVSGAEAANLCLAWSIEDGTCVQLSQSITTADKIVDCSQKSTTPGDVVRLVSVEDGADAKCEKPAIAVPNEKRDFTLCLADNS